MVPYYVKFLQLRCSSSSYVDDVSYE